MGLREVVNCDYYVFWGANYVPGARPASSMTLIPFNGDILCIAWRQGSSKVRYLQGC